MRCIIRWRRVCCCTRLVRSPPPCLRPFSYPALLPLLPNPPPGSHYNEVYRNTSVLLLRNLVSTGLVTCSAENAFALNLHRLFMPHGLGHLIGLDVHDPFIYPHRLQPPQPLQHGMVLTCEPGICEFVGPSRVSLVHLCNDCLTTTPFALTADFVPSLIREALGVGEKAACINRESVLRMQNSVGGMYFWL